MVRSQFFFIVKNITLRALNSGGKEQFSKKHSVFKRLLSTLFKDRNQTTPKFTISRLLRFTFLHTTMLALSNKTFKTLKSNGSTVAISTTIIPTILMVRLAESSLSDSMTWGDRQCVQAFGMALKTIILDS